MCYQSPLHGSSVVVLLVSCLCSLYPVADSIKFEDFIGYPFGAEYGYSLFPRGVDLYEGGPTTIPFPYFGQKYNFVNIDDSGYVALINGQSTVSTPFSAGTIRFPFKLTAANIDWSAVIAPFWADISTDGYQSGRIYFKNFTKGEEMQATADVRKLIASTIPQLRGFTPEWTLIVTWDQVGYFNDNDDKLNTLQMVITTDGRRSIAIFNYAEDGINWVTGDADNGVNGFGGTPAIAGYNAGDGVRHTVLPGSFTEDIQFIDNLVGNTGRVGQWIFRIDVERPIVLGCQGNDVRLVKVFPSVGNVLGGTPVVVSGPCVQDVQDASDVAVTCTFDNVSVEGEYLMNQSQFLCITPQLQTIGRIPFTLEFTQPNSTDQYRGYATFYIVSAEYGHEVEVSGTLFLEPQSKVMLYWNPNILPYNDPQSYQVDIVMYEIDEMTGSLSSSYELKQAINNNGSDEVVIPILRNLEKVAAPVVVKVREAMALSARRKRNTADDSQLGGVWSGIFFSTAAVGGGISIARRKACDIWSKEESANIGPALLATVIPCPPRLEQARLPNSGLIEVNLTSVFGSSNYNQQYQLYLHRNTTICFQQRARENALKEGQECCYDEDGNLTIGQSNGGSVNKYAPKDYSSSVDHIREDILPYIYCCKAGMFSRCDEYYQRRPSDNGDKYQPPPPACVYGDPHIVTLDGHKYTFNGKGEFTMISTEDNQFTLQGRMIEASDVSGNNASATVFSSLVAKETHSDVVQIDLSPIGLIARVNGEEVDFADNPLQDFNNVTVADRGNQTLAAVFLNYGEYIEVKVENDIISVVLVSLPVSYKGLTRGLMGNYNGNTSDDLIPQGGEAIPVESSLKDIHEQFGITWIIDSPAQSLFTYEEGKSWQDYYDPDFTPMFSPVFNDSALESSANATCKGDLFCLFDIAATKNVQIGMSTFEGSANFEMMVELSTPTICDPPCEHGVCVANNSCNCAVGYSGSLCSEADIHPCQTNICLNGGTCQEHVITTTCHCHAVFTGSLCETVLITPTVWFVRKTNRGYVLSWTIAESEFPFVSSVRVSVSPAMGEPDAAVQHIELNRHVRAFHFTRLKHSRQYRFEVAVKAIDTYGPPAAVEREF